MDETDDDRLLSGDLEDFGRFYDRYARTLLGFFQRRTADPEAAADLTAETFAAALVSRARYRPQPAGAAAWLFAIAHRKLADYHRRGRAESRMRARLGMEPVPLEDEDVELIRWLGQEVATQIVDELPEDQREVIRAHVLDDLGYAEIAHSRQLSEAAVRKRVSRGLKVLRERVGGIR
jgi:RNA polymerase sigma-70 factor (ECF subfamily)